MTGDDRNRSWRRAPLPPEWPAIRRRILERDGGRCRLRTPGICTVSATEVDHIGGHDDHGAGNLRSVCGPCHRRRTGVENGRRLWAGGSRNRPPERHPGLKP